MKSKDKSILVVLSLLVVSIFLFVSSTGCATAVKRSEAYSYTYTGEKFNVPKISLSPDMEEKLKGNAVFDINNLSDAVKLHMNSKGLLSDSAKNTIEIILTDVRVRSGFSAVMFGFMAGADRLEGDVSIRSAEGKVINNFKVSASYAMGGVAGGSNEVRMGWLYDKFAELTVAEILGEKKD